MKSKNDYRHIRAWGRMLGSNREYVWDQVQKARADNAPDDAIYYGADKRWHTYSEVTVDSTRHVMDRLLASKNQGV